jgi:pimeloyl-ACP methyl ester carboxylesterase
MPLDPSGQPRCIVKVRRGETPASAEGARPWANRFEDFALLSAIVYRSETGNVTAPAGWTPSPDPRDVMDDPGTSLYFEVWERAQPDAVDVAVVFRGTHEWKDWWSNCRWVTRFIPVGWDQYDLTRRKIADVVTRARQRHSSARVVTTGHSLGGGLAQQAAYAHPEMRLFVRTLVPLSLRDPSITEVRFNLSKGDAIKEHSMVDLARRMARAARECPS